MLSALDGHFASRGKQVDASILNTATYLSYYNGGSGGLAYSSMLVPELQAIWQQQPSAVALPPAGVMSPALQSDWNAALTHGMGSRAVGGSFTAGATVDTTQYSGVNLVAEVRVAFASGLVTAPTITVAGTDDTGATSTTWSVVPGDINPAGALSGLTITPAIVAYTKLSVTVSSSTGIVPGSVLTINKGLPDQEVVLVESVADGTHMLCAFKKAHAGGATIDGWNSYALAPSVGTRRCTHVSGITFTLHTHDAGTVQLNGCQDKVGI